MFRKLRLWWRNIKREYARGTSGPRFVRRKQRISLHSAGYSDVEPFEDLTENNSQK